MTKKKILFLILALLLPAILFLFLKMFGRNEFDVPVLYQEGIENAPATCNYHYPVPYRIADTVMAALPLNKRDSLFVFYFDPAVRPAMERIPSELRDAPIHVISASEIPPTFDKTLLRECILLMHRDTSVALVDHRNRIRGYYKGSDRDEIDRLIVEMKIILKQY